MRYMNDMSPWGMIDECREVIDGVYIIGTPSHGGVLVEKRVHDNFNYAAKKHAINWGKEAWYEEDCAQAVAFNELIRIYGMKVMTDLCPHLTGERILRIIEDVLKRVYPTYLEKVKLSEAV